MTTGLEQRAPSAMRIIIVALHVLSTSSFAPHPASCSSWLSSSSSSSSCWQLAAAAEAAAEAAAGEQEGGEDGGGGGSTRTQKRPLARRDDLAEAGYMLETMEEYDARRAAAVQAYGGRVEKPETPGQYAARRLRNEREKAARLAKNAAYAAACEGPLPGRDFSEVQNGDVLSGCEFVSELGDYEADRRQQQKRRRNGGRGGGGGGGGSAGKTNQQQHRSGRPKAWFDAGLWRRRARDGLPVAVQAMVRLWREDPAEVAYFLNDKAGRKQRLYVVDAQHASGRLVASFSPRGSAFEAGGGRGGSAAALPEGEVLLEDLAVGQALQATVVGVTKHAAWLSVPVRRRCRGTPTTPRAGAGAGSSGSEGSSDGGGSSGGDGFVYRKVNARLHDRDLEASGGGDDDCDLDEDALDLDDPARQRQRTVILSSQRVRSEDVERVIGRGDSFTVFVKSVYLDSAKFDVCLDEATAKEGEARRAAAAQRRKRERRRRARRTKATRRLLEEAAAAAAAAAASPNSDSKSVERIGRVARVERYGLLVDVGATMKGLVHISDVAKADWLGKPPPVSGGGSGSSSGSGGGAAAFVEDLSKLVPKGQRLVVKLKPQPPAKNAKESPAGGRPKLSFEIVRWLGSPPVDPSYFPEEVEEDSGASGADEQDEWEALANSMFQEEDDDDDDDDYDEEEEDLDAKWESKFWGEEAY